MKTNFINSTFTGITFLLITYEMNPTEGETTNATEVSVVFLR